MSVSVLPPDRPASTGSTLRPRTASLPTLHRRRAARLFGDDTGAATAEYAIATMAAVAFASLLVVIMRSDEVRGILTDLIRRALTVV
jgi:Flp pilus assembly pilin Flp